MDIESLIPSVLVGSFGLVIMGLVILNDRFRRQKRARVSTRHTTGYPRG